MLVQRKHFSRAALVVAVALALLPASAIASNVLGHKAGSNYVVTFNEWYLNDHTEAAFHYNDTNSIEPTNIASAIYHNTGGLEVNVHDAYYGNTGWYGEWRCRAWSGSVCTDGLVRINLSYGPYTTTEKRSLVCEEIGHAVGLDHSSESASCMSQRWDRTLLTSHDKTHLNNRY